MPIQTRTRGSEALLKTLDNLKNDARQMQDVAVQFLAAEAKVRSQEVAPVKTGFLRDNITGPHQEDLAYYLVISEAEYSLYVEVGFQHYRDGFIPGRFYMQQGANFAEALAEEGALDELLQTEIDIRTVSPYDDV